mgnify:CR=1 FL=1|jgi:hypothetical protein
MFSNLSFNNIKSLHFPMNKLQLIKFKHKIILKILKFVKRNYQNYIKINFLQIPAPLNYSNI